MIISPGCRYGFNEATAASTAFPAGTINRILRGVSSNPPVPSSHWSPYFKLLWQVRRHIIPDHRITVAFKILRQAAPITPRPRMPKANFCSISFSIISSTINAGRG